MCLDESKELIFKFFASHPSSECEWKSVEKMRQASPDPEVFDQMLLNNVTMLVENPEEAYPSQNAVWKHFLAVFKALAGLVFYGPGVKDFVHRAMVSMIEDNVQYVEMRSLLPPVYEADGSIHDMQWLMESLLDVNTQLLKEYPTDFSGFKLIYTSDRKVSREVIRDAINTTLQLQAKYPNFMVGYDLVAHEDAGFTLLHFINELLYPSQIGQNLPFFFHAGETDWYGQSTDINILDAILLNTSRIGHGYAITKHPWAMQEAKKRDIPLEVNPISNQVLKYVDDLRNHPAVNLMAVDFPLVISADDPSLWGVSGLSYDYYAAFMALGGAWADLGTLKKLAKNSIKYSAMSIEEKVHTMNIWEKKWEKFIEEIDQTSILHFSG
ncbi:hypothetical protein CAPTEDRAFT_167117 [Capitella teleta]|uniref:adenosine deaminase n=1 Tax=Capitella teleta TaxID=283909 RepID=R7V2W4_CAPTE|nr:hypothetical protein CAPTEDRAFT_167117 [Capitella teleta]|eukprot:ELU12827.1 hypothetical protein CAPTEDRAFT_167117 [Capitella teleta]